MAYLGADKLIFDEKWLEFDRLVAGKRGCQTSSGCIANGVRFAIESQLGLGQAAAFFRAADKLGAHREFAALIPIKLVDYIKLQLGEKGGTAQEKATRRRNLFNVLGELQNREALLKAVQRALAPNLLFALAARTIVDKVNGRLVRSEAQGAPVIVVREPKPNANTDYVYRVMVDYGAGAKNETFEGGPKAVTLDVLQRYSGAPGRSLQEAAAIIVRMRQGFWGISRQVVQSPVQRESALRQFDASQKLMRKTHALKGNFPDIRLEFVCASIIARAQARLVKGQARAKQQPDDTALAERNIQAQQRIAKLKRALVLIDRLHKLRSVLAADPRARSMHNSRLQLNQRLAAKAPAATATRPKAAKPRPPVKGKTRVTAPS